MRLRFHELPVAVRAATALTFLNTWILVAELVIDRYGFDEYLPLYRYGDVCIWDLAVVALVTTLFVRGSRARRGEERSSDAGGGTRTPDP